MGRGRDGSEKSVRPQMGQVREKAWLRTELTFVIWETEWLEMPSIEGKDVWRARRQMRLGPVRCLLDMKGAFEDVWLISILYAPFKGQGCQGKDREDEVGAGLKRPALHPALLSLLSEALFWGENDQTLKSEAG